MDVPSFVSQAGEQNALYVKAMSETSAFGGASALGYANAWLE
jgi:hypothetical protein